MTQPNDWRQLCADLIEVVRMPNVEHVADAHNEAVRKLKALAAEPASTPKTDEPDAEVTYEAGAYVKTGHFELLIAVGHGPTEHAARKKLSAELHRLDRERLRYSGSNRRIKVIRRRGEKIEEISVEDWT